MTHLLFAALTVAGIYLTTFYAPLAEITFTFVIGFGYICMVFLCITLLIGPLNLLRKRLNPVNINLRRDTGIWAGITGSLHVFFALLERNRGGILSFFFHQNGRPLLTLLGASNWIGLFATILLIALLATSNMLSLRTLKGKRWKKLQRLNYVLVVLAFMHVYGYQMGGGRERYFMDGTVIAMILVLVAQLVGVAIYQRRKQAHLLRQQI